MSSPSSDAPSEAPAQSGKSVEVLFDPTKEQGVWDILKNLKWQEFSLDNVAKMPCSRSALLYGLSAGTTVGLTRYLLRRNGRSAGNWGVLTFGTVSVAYWELCRLQRRVMHEQLASMSASDRARIAAAAQAANAAAGVKREE
ncbi:Cytochrome c oxidase assembly protein cox20, mitochondrial [Phlyctochytrium bullatum]|nr:Cytochrome c oxidase assembly protein cox20, mitochondrial [Phlyctochytrium bullatum]